MKSIVSRIRRIWRRSLKMIPTPGARLRLAMREERPLQVIGTINAYVALMAKRAGYRALYVSGAGVANSAYGLPDVGITTLENVVEEVRRLTAAVDLPVAVDIDTGWGDAGKTVQEMIRVGAAAAQIEDQVVQKRCGHLSGKKLVPVDEMVARIRSAFEGKTDNDFVIIARTDAASVEGLEGVIERGNAYREAGADVLFPEALTNLEEFARVKKEVKIPILANVTEFGKTPLLSLDELKQADIDIVLYPLSVNRAMNKAAQEVLRTIRIEGTQKRMLNRMQTREELYSFLDYKGDDEKLNE